MEKETKTNRDQNNKKAFHPFLLKIFFRYINLYYYSTIPETAILRRYILAIFPIAFPLFLVQKVAV